MNYERQKRLVERLLDRTRAGQLSWQEGVDTDSFQVSFPTNSVSINAISEHRRADYQVSIIDSSGRTTEVFNDDQLDKEGAHFSGSWNSIMQELFRAARRSALKSDEVLDSILAEIG